MSSEATPMAALSEIKRLATRRQDIESSSPLYRQLYDRLRRAVFTCNFSPRSQLPSATGVARGLGIARNTVMAAYEQLLAEGYLEGEWGSGTYVSQALPEHLLNAALQDRPVTGAPGRSPQLSRRGAALAAIPHPVGSEPVTACAFRLGSPALDALPFV